MASINTSDFRKGTKVLMDGDPYEMTEVNFVKPGKGQALYKCKLRNLIKGTLLDRTWKSGDSLEGADIRHGDGQYLYKEANGYVFMDPETFDQVTIANEVVGDQAPFLQDGCKCQLLFWNETVIGMTAPQHVVMKITYTEPAARGNTASNLTKPATLENGVEITVPAFVENGEMVKVNTQTREYVERVRE